MNRQWGISQEWLKIIACVTMLIDHIGAVFFPWDLEFRIIGRLAFPIYCFLLAEGLAWTRNAGRYALRLAVGVLLAEIPFDFLFFRGWTWGHQNVMITLLLGCLTVIWMEKMGNWKVFPLLICMSLAELLHTDYGATGVLMVAMFSLTRNHQHRRWIQTLLLGLLCWYKGGLQLYAVAAMVPIALYSGKKITRNPWIQRGFYLFYPVHLLILAVIAGRFGG